MTHANRSGRFALLFLALFLLASGCDSSLTLDDRFARPDTYTFTRDGVSTVAYEGQTARLDMVDEMKAVLTVGDGGGLVAEQMLLDMFANTDDNGGGHFSFSSEKQLKNKTFSPDLDARLFETLFANAAVASQAGSQGVQAADGTAGLITRESKGTTILVDANGREFTQVVEKGLMGAVFYNQIYNTYLTDAKIGDAVENTALVDGKPYTAMEHHWDEAFGYWAPPLDFTSPWPAGEPDGRFWSHYSNVVDAHLGTNARIMDAFIDGRTAIVNGNRAAKNVARDVLYAQLDLVAAAVAVHYINATLSHLDAGFTGEAFHTLSEAWAFTNALRYNPRRVLSAAEIETIMGTDFGANGNFWNVTPAGLNTAKAKLVAAYPALTPVQDAL